MGPCDDPFTPEPRSAHAGYAKLRTVRGNSESEPRRTQVLTSVLGKTEARPKRSTGRS